VPLWNDAVRFPFVILAKIKIMKKYFILPMLLTVATYAQSFQWLDIPQIDLTLNPGTAGYASTIDAAGNTFVTGFQDNAYSYGDIFGDVFFSKYDDSAAIQFSKTFTGRVAVYDITTDTDGNLLMAIGYVNSALIGDLAFSTNAQGIQPLLVKFDNDGNMLWHHIPVIPDSFEAYFHAVATDESGNVYIGYDDFQNSYIEKLSPEGVSQQIIPNLNVKMLTSIDIDTQGNIYAAGSCAENNASFASVGAPTDFQYNTWVAKYSPDGVFQWARYIDDITCSTPEVKANEPDQVYFSSALYGPYQFGEFTAQGPSNNFSGDIFITRLNADGIFQWVAEVPAGNAGTVEPGNRNYLDVDSSGQVLFCGSTRNTIAWNNDIATASQGFASDAIVLKYSPEGILLVAKTFGGTSEDRADGATFNALGDISVSGMARGNATFDSFSHEAEDLASYPYIGKITSTVILDNPEYDAASISVWPNPVNNMLHFSADEAIEGEIFNVLAQKVQSFKIEAGQSLNVANLSNGVYFIKTGTNAAIRFVKS
jgi:hypothetical protein